LEDTMATTEKHEWTYIGGAGLSTPKTFTPKMDPDDWIDECGWIPFERHEWGYTITTICWDEKAEDVVAVISQPTQEEFWCVVRAAPILLDDLREEFESHFQDDANGGNDFYI